jgi:xylose isomerase
MKSLSLESIYENVKSKDINPEPQSGRQEYLENLLNSFIE